MEDIVGKKFNRLTVLRKTDDRDKEGRVIYEVTCDCGEILSVPRRSLTTGRKRSCGCLAKDLLIKRNTTHGLSKHPLYGRWNAIRKRCYLKTYSKYEYYGAKGVKMCDEWRENPQSFYDWYDSQGGDLTLTVERINTYGDYEPSNCKLIPQSEQPLNVRPRKDSKKGG